VKKSDKFIVFNERQQGSDGYEYIQNVKYRIRRETTNAFYLPGRRKDFHNRLTKSRLQKMFVVGAIIRGEV